MVNFQDLELVKKESTYVYICESRISLFKEVKQVIDVARLVGSPYQPSMTMVCLNVLLVGSQEIGK